MFPREKRDHAIVEETFSVRSVLGIYNEDYMSAIQTLLLVEEEVPFENTQKS
jgi:hypothetical protein